MDYRCEEWPSIMTFTLSFFCLTFSDYDVICCTSLCDVDPYLSLCSIVYSMSLVFMYNVRLFVFIMSWLCFYHAGSAFSFCQTRFCFRALFSVVAIVLDCETRGWVFNSKCPLATSNYSRYEYTDYRIRRSPGLNRIYMIVTGC